jgi:hypothetical protein
MANATVATYPGRGLIWRSVAQAGSPTIPKNIGWGSNATVTGSASANVNMFTPQTEARTVGTPSILTTTQLGDTYQVTGTIVCASAGKTITEAAIFDSATAPTLATITGTSLASGATTVTLSANVAPTSGNSYAQIENETVLLTGANSTTLSLTRGVLGTSAAAHAIGVSVTGGGDGGAGGWTTGQTSTWGASNGGNMFIHADFAGIALNVSDSISLTFTDTLT